MQSDDTTSHGYDATEPLSREFYEFAVCACRLDSVVPILAVYKLSLLSRALYWIAEPRLRYARRRRSAWESRVVRSLLVTAYLRMSGVVYNQSLGKSSVYSLSMLPNDTSTLLIPRACVPTATSGEYIYRFINSMTFFCARPKPFIVRIFHSRICTYKIVPVVHFTDIGDGAESILLPRIEGTRTPAGRYMATVHFGFLPVCTADASFLVTGMNLPQGPILIDEAEYSWNNITHFQYDETYVYGTNYSVACFHDMQIALDYYCVRRGGMGGTDPMYNDARERAASIKRLRMLFLRDRSPP